MLKLILTLLLLWPSALHHLFERFELKLDDASLKCLVDNAFHEARGEGQTGMLLVTRVVLNRVEDSKRGVCEVVYARKQFSWTSQKKPRKVPKEVRARLERMIVAFLSDAITDPLPTALSRARFYHARSVAPGWSGRVPRLGVHAGHVFYGKETRKLRHLI
jgi:spore germination cell wall hydrolase CwlJ-like protein